MEVATFLFQTSQERSVASYLNTSIAPKILPILHSNLWQRRDLPSSALGDFNLKFVNTCNLLSRAYNVGSKARLNHLRRSENIQHHIECITIC